MFRINTNSITKTWLTTSRADLRAIMIKHNDMNTGSTRDILRRLTNGNVLELEGRGMMLCAGIDERRGDVSLKSRTREKPGLVAASTTGLVVDAVWVVVFKL